MIDRDVLQRRLSRARRALLIMEEEASWFGKTHLPDQLQLEIEEQLAEITKIERSLSQFRGEQDAIFPDNLPFPPSIFIGRDNEIKRCLDVLSDALIPHEYGWGVTIEGHWGIGKTTLALKVAHETRKRDWFDAYLFSSARTHWRSAEDGQQESLTPTALDSFIREFALTLGKTNILRISDPVERRNAMQEALRGHHALIVLDNLEVLSNEEYTRVTEFLGNLPAPNKAIVTTRHHPGGGSVPVRLEPFNQQETLAMITQVGQRYLRVAAQLNRADISQRAGIHEATGGNPLIIQWALGLIAQKSYSFAKAIELLEGAKQESNINEHLFEKAFRTLTKNDQNLLAGLSIFQNAAAPAMLADATGLPPTEVQIALEQLTTLSLVHDMKGGYYSLHPLMRPSMYALLRMGNKSKLFISQTSAKHDLIAHRNVLRYWVNFAQRYGSSKETEKLDHLEAEWDNLESTAIALRDLAGLADGVTKDRDAAQMLNELAVALRSFLRSYGYWSEWERLSTWAYDATCILNDWHNAGWRAYDVAFVCWNRIRTEAATIWAERMNEAMERGGTPRDRAIATRLRGLVAEQRGDLEGAERIYTEALEECRTLGRKADEASILNDLAEVCFRRRDYEHAEKHYRQALALAEEMGDKEDQATFAGNLGNLALVQNNLAEAHRWYEHELKLAREAERYDLVSRAQSGLAYVLEKEGRHAEALPLAEEALQISERLRNRIRAGAGTRELVTRLRDRQSHRR